jgi:hypothetical protein
MNNGFHIDLLKEKQIKLINNRGNKSAPGLDEITFTFLELKKSVAQMIIATTIFIVLRRKNI